MTPYDFIASGALRDRGHASQAVAHFVNRLVFCMFADDVGLLPEHMFTRMLRQVRRTPEHFTELAGALFRVMASGGRVGFEAVAWFNGGLFDDGEALPLEKAADLGRTGTRRRGPVAGRPHQAAQGGRAALPGVPGPAAQVHGAGPGVRLGQLPLSRAAGAQGPGAPGAARGRGAGVSARLPGIDLTLARRLPENAGVAFMGDTKGGPFDVPGDLAREWLRLPANPNGRPTPTS